MHDARLSSGTKNYALTRDSASRYFGTSGGAAEWKKEKRGKNRRLLGNPLCMKTGRKMSFLRIPLIKTRSEKNKSALCAFIIKQSSNLSFSTFRSWLVFSQLNTRASRENRMIYNTYYLTTGTRCAGGKYIFPVQFGAKTMPNRARDYGELNQVTVRHRVSARVSVYARQIFPKTGAQSMRNANDHIHAAYEVGIPK